VLKFSPFGTATRIDTEGKRSILTTTQTDIKAKRIKSGPKVMENVRNYKKSVDERKNRRRCKSAREVGGGGGTWGIREE